MKSTAAKRLYNYWNEIRGSRIAPRRFEIEPTSIAEILPETFILEYDEPKSVNFRLSGTLVCDMFAREFRGQSIYSIWQKEDRDIIEEGIVSIVNNGAVFLIEVDAITETGHEAKLEMIMMPLLHNGEKITRLIGTFAANSYDPNLLARLDPIQSLHLTQSTIVWPDGHPHKLLPKEVLASALPPKIVTSQNRRFRVFEGGLNRHPNREHH